jgi:predicted DNA-binding antitoxin AbrB/MazE fold protein
MREQIEVIYENGVLRPLSPLPGRIQERQHLLVTIEAANGADRWLADANPAVSLETVRQALAKIQGTLAQAVHAEREER